jgi:PAS domain S-box-containing protein
MPLRLLPLVIAPAILLPLAVYAFRHRHVRGAAWYGTLLLAIALWSAVYAWELAVGDPAVKLLALKIKYVGVVLLPVAWLGFILDFAAREPAVVHRVGRRMAVVAAFTLLVAWTNESHGLFWGRMTLAPVGTLYTFSGRGPGFWLNIVYTYGVLFVGLAILVGQAVQSPYLYRKRTVIVVLATVLPWIGNLIFVARAEGPGTIDLTPFLFTCTALIAAVAVFRYRVLEPIPTLRDARIEVIGDGILILDRSRRIADLNGAAEAIIRRGRASAGGEPIEHVLPGWPSESDVEVRLDLTLGGPGGDRIYDVRITPIRTAGEPLTGYVVLLRDVTERRHTEVALRDSELRYRELVENARDLICTCDLDGRIVAVNQAGLDLTGYSSQELVGRQLLELVAPESREHATAVFTGRQPDLHSERTEIALIASGRRRVVLEVASWVQRRDGVPIAVQAIGRDVTERRRLEEELRQAQKMEAVGKLAGGVAHDFNNLLTAIIGFAAMAEAEQTPGTPMHEWMVEIRRSGDQAATLTRQLLAFGRRQMLRPIDLDLNRVVDDIQRMLRRLIGEDVELLVQLAPDLRPVRADRSQVEQVIVNLVVNARDAMPRGGRLTIRTENVVIEPRTSPVVPGPAAGQYASLAVEDTGEGIDVAILGRIFDPFFTTKAFGRGTGLGLSTVYGVVKQSSGDVQVRSTPGRGAIFTVLLPAIMSRTAATEPAETSEVVQASAANTTGASLLIVEDDSGVRKFTTQVLRDAGWTVLEAQDPAGALAIAARESQPLDLLLTDVVLPGINGSDLAARVCTLRPGLPVLFMSGYAPEEIVASGALPRRGELLRKPFRPAALRERVAQILKTASSVSR